MLIFFTLFHLFASAMKKESTASAMIAPSKKVKISKNDKQLPAAIQEGKSDAVCTLLQDGANANAVTKSGDPALHRAMSPKADIAIITLLLEHKADPNQPINGDMKHKTPLFMAYQIARPDIAKMLLAFGAKPELHEKYYKSLRFESLAQGEERHKIL